LFFSACNVEEHEGLDESSDDDESLEFWDMVLAGVNVAQTYVDLYLNKKSQRVADTSGMGCVLFILKTPCECHTQLRMNTEIFIDLHDLLVLRYGLQSSMHVNTYEALAILLFIFSGNESNRKTQNRFNHSGETISRKFSNVLSCMMTMAKDFIVPKDPNFYTVHTRIRDNRRAYPHMKDCIGALDGTHVRVSLHPSDQVRYIGKAGIPTQNILAVCDFDMRFTYYYICVTSSLSVTLN
jgi:hypothetical protein